MTIECARHPRMKDLNSSNHLIGDRPALDAAWERDGYWFFRDVLDRDAIARFRNVYRRELADLGYCDEEDDLVRYNGVSLDAFPMRMEPLARRQPWKSLMAEPTIRARFRSLLGREAFWLPMAEYRATPPAAQQGGSRFEFIHQDGMYNAGIVFQTCWIPLVEIDADVGGIAVAEGMHRGGFVHRSSGLTVNPIDIDDIPADRWRRAYYQPGDLLLMDSLTPHSGLSNLSDRFRLSLDIRLLADNDRKPTIGRLSAIGTDRILVRDETGEHAFRVDDTTFFRDSAAHRFSRSEIWQHIHVDDEVIVAADGDLATVLRPIH